MSKHPTPSAGLFPHLTVNDAAAALRFYYDALGGKLSFKLGMPDGKIGHAEVEFDNGRIMLADEFVGAPCVAPSTDRRGSIQLALYVENVDQSTANAARHGAVIEQSPKDEFYGDRVARIVDPFGHRWTLHTRIEELSPETMRERMAELGDA